MGAKRVVAVTCGAVAVLAVVLLILRWDDANKVAVVVSALAAVAAVGVTIWAALFRGGSRAGLRVSRTGKAKAGMDETANSGFEGPVGALKHDVEVSRTGEAEGGSANTGVRLS
jgi:hypothetical protein